MNQEYKLYRISQLLSRFREQAKILNSNGEFSINIHAENILINLLNNAIDALEYAEVKLILVEASIVDKWVEIHIKDSGAGVPAEIESKIFDSFFTTKKYGKGTGLGLSISKGLVEIHEGSLKYQRTGNMTDFVVRLPSYE